MYESMPTWVYTVLIHSNTSGARGNSFVELLENTVSDAYEQPCECLKD